MLNLGVYGRYFLIVIIVFIWENLFAGNLVTQYGQDYAKITLPNAIKNILFPIFHIKRFTYASILYQGFNFLVFIFMIIVGVFVELKTMILIFKIYISFQKFYWLCGPLLLSASVSFKETRWAIRMNKEKKNNVNTLSNILKNMNAQTIELEGITMFFVEPSTGINGYAFLLYGGSNYSIPDIDYIDILNNLLNQGCLLVYIPSDTFEEYQEYATVLESMMYSFEEKYNIKKASVFLIGRVVLDMPIMVLLSNQWKCVNGMIWISAETKKELTKGLKKELSNYAKQIVMARSEDICIVCIYERGFMDKLNIWLAGKMAVFHL